MTNVLIQWLANLWPRARITPSQADIAAQTELLRTVFDNKPGHDLLVFWIEQVVFANPRTTNEGECVAFAAKCAFVEDLLRALDRARDPGKYGQMESAPVMTRIDPRRAA